MHLPACYFQLDDVDTFATAATGADLLAWTRDLPEDPTSAAHAQHVADALIARFPDRPALPGFVVAIDRRQVAFVADDDERMGMLVFDPDAAPVCMTGQDVLIGMQMHALTADADHVTSRHVEAALASSYPVAVFVVDVASDTHQQTDDASLGGDVDQEETPGGGDRKVPSPDPCSSNPNARSERD